MNDKVADAVDLVRSELKELKESVSKIGGSTEHILQCLLNGPATPDLLTEENIVPTAAKQYFDEKDKTRSKLILTLTTPDGAAQRNVEVVFDGVEKPALPKKASGTPSGQYELKFDLPELWYEEQGPRFVTVNIIDTTKAPPPPTPPTPAPPITPTMRRILPATVPKHDEDDD